MTKLTLSDPNFNQKAHDTLESLKNEIKSVKKLMKEKEKESRYMDKLAPKKDKAFDTSAEQLVKKISKIFGSLEMGELSRNSTIEHEGRVFSVNISITVDGEAPANAPAKSPSSKKAPQAAEMSESLSEAVFAHLETLEKAPMKKDEFQEALSKVDGYEPSMWDQVKGNLEYAEGKGRGTKFFPRKAQAAEA